MTQPWAIHVPLLPDELFSAWLVRAALAQGCDPMHLTSSLWPRWRAWTIDLDRGLKSDRLAVLATRSGIDASRLEAAMLHLVIAAVAPGVRPEQANWPWLLSQGSRNRRRRGGLQFCPLCLSEDPTPYFRRAWRLAWHVGCPRHGRLLADHCGRCLSPAEPHRTRAVDLTLCRCTTCSHDLRHTRTLDVCADALAFQVAADEVLASGSGTWSASIVTCATWFEMAAKHAGGKILGRSEDAAVEGITSLALNLQRPSERALRLRMAFRGMNNEPRGRPLLVSRQVDKPDRSVVLSDERQHEISCTPTIARPQAKVQGEWIRLLRRLRIGQP